MALPSSGKSNPLRPEISANFPLPRLIKKQFLSFPLNDLPASIIRERAVWPEFEEDLSFVLIPSVV